MFPVYFRFRLTPMPSHAYYCRMRKLKANGAAIRALREAVTGMSVSAFAPRVGVTQGYLSNVELGHKQPTNEFLSRVARELGVPLSAISFFCAECAECEAVA